MSAKRSLKLHEAATENQHGTAPGKKYHERNQHFSPTGTCQIRSPASPNKNRNAFRFKKEAFNGEHSPLVWNGKAGRKERTLSDVHVEVVLSNKRQIQTEEDDFMALLSEVEKSLEKFVKIRKSLKHLQALEGSSELENVIGRPDTSRNLKAELQKTQVLMVEVEKRKRLLSVGQHLLQDSVPPISSYEFLKSIIH